MRRLVVVLSALLVLLSVLLIPARVPSAAEYFGPNGRWAGWVSTSGPFTSVSASWTVPAVTCGSAQDRFAAWVGIDGYGNNTVEQVGTRANCANGYPQYNAWTEFFPDGPVFYDAPGLYPGDAVTATVTRNGNSVTLDLTNRTHGWYNRTTRTTSVAASSAEAVLESPSKSYPAFGSLRFTDVRANRAYLGRFSPFPISARNTAGAVIAEPGPLQQPATAFDVYDDAH